MNFKKILKNKLVFLILKFKKYDPKQTIVIFSEARGGSTWLMEILSHVFDATINWEPLHLDKGVVPKEFNFGWNTHLDKESEEKKYLTFFKAVHSFQLNNIWTNKFVGFKKILKSKILLVKYVRANPLAPYILKNFKFNIKPVFLIRHPIDVAISFVKAFDGSSDKPIFKFKDSICKDVYLKYETYLQSLKTNVELRVAIWCIDNCKVIKELILDERVFIMYYSDLVLEPELTIINYLESNNLQKYNRKISQFNFKKVSATAFNTNSVHDPVYQLSKNIDGLSLEQKIRIQNVFDYFDFKLYSAFEYLPQKNNI